MRRHGRTVRRVTTGNGGIDPIHLPDAEARYVRISMHGAKAGYALSEIDVKDLAFGASANAFFLRAREIRTTRPLPARVLRRANVLDGARRRRRPRNRALFRRRRARSRERRLLDRAVRRRRRRQGDELGRCSDLAFAARRIPADSERGLAHARVCADDDRVRDRCARSLVAHRALRDRQRGRRGARADARSPSCSLSRSIRPCSFSTRRVASARSTTSRSRAARSRSTASRACSRSRNPENAFGSTFDAGLAPEHLGASAKSETSHPAFATHDDTGLASGALLYRLSLLPGQRSTIAIAVPLEGDATTPPAFARGAAAEWSSAQLDETAANWARVLNRVSIDAPKAQPLVDTLRTALADILISRDGPGAASGHALVRAFVDSRRRDDVRCIAAARPRRGRARILRLVRAVSVRERQGAVLRRSSRLRSRARKRQSRRADPSRGRDPSLHGRSRGARIGVAACRCGGAPTWTRCARASVARPIPRSAA